MDGEGDVLGHGSHFDCQDAFGNQRFGLRSDHAHTQYLV
jgi:hypothetical protein